MFRSPESLVPVFFIILAMIPIVGMLTKHQQRMAEIIHGAGNRESDAEVDHLRREVMELKQLVLHQTIALDSLTSGQTRQREPELADRLKQS